MSESTSINTLPNENTSNNVVMNVKDNQSQLQPMSNSTELSQESINEIVKGIQTASQQNLTGLPSRDIPMDTMHITSDNSVRPNYIPKESEDYINKEYDLQTMIENNNKNNNKQDRLDVLYEEFQIPLFIMLLYFLSQLPFVNQFMLNNLPSLFNKDATPKLSGYLIKTILFGTTFYLTSKGTKYLSEI